VTPSVAPAFEACGGEPFGVWESDEISAPSFTLRLYQRNAFGGFIAAGSCPTQVTELGAPASMRLALLDGGEAVMTGTGVSLSFHLLDSCVQETLGQSCTQLELNGECAAQCGVCDCHMMGNSARLDAIAAAFGQLVPGLLHYRQRDGAARCGRHLDQDAPHQLVLEPHRLRHESGRGLFQRLHARRVRRYGANLRCGQQRG
jgi:hypothetical protein